MCLFITVFHPTTKIPTSLYALYCLACTFIVSCSYCPHDKFILYFVCIYEIYSPMYVWYRNVNMLNTLTCLRLILPCACTLYIVILLDQTKQVFITWSTFQCLLLIYTFTSFNINNVSVAWNSYRGGKPNRRRPNQISAKFAVFPFSEIPFGKV